MAAAQRFDRRALQGAALVGVVFGAYLTIATDFSAVIQAAGYAGSIPSDVPLVNEVQFATILAVFLFSFAVLAVTPMRRAIALTSVPLVLLGWAFLGVERGNGVLPLGDATVWSVLLNQGFITLVLALGGWLIARGWHPLSWLVLLVALVPPLVGALLDAAKMDATAYTLVIQAVVIVAGAVGAVGGLAIDRARRATHVDAIALRESDVRYGLGVGLTVMATYLTIATDFSGYLQQTSFAGSASVSLLGMLQFLLILLLFVAAMAVMPVSADRRLAAITYVSVLLLLWATFGIERSVGNIRDPVALWFFLLDQGFVTMLVALGGWLIVRGRHPLSAVVLVLAIVPPIVARTLVDASVTSGAYTLVIEGIVVLGSVAGAMLAWLIDATARGRVREWFEHRRTRERPVAVTRAARGALTRPRAVTTVAIVVWIGGALQVLGGVQSFADQSAAGEAQRSTDLVSALITVAIGVVTIVVGVQLLRASRVARVIVTIFVALQLLVAAVLLAVTVVAGDPVAAVIAGVATGLDVVAIVMLWAGSAASFFRRRPLQPS
jgi:hypothetical protein